MNTNMDPAAAQRYIEEKLAAARNAVAARNRRAFIDAVNSIATDAPVPADVRTQLSKDVWNTLIDNASPRLIELLKGKTQDQEVPDLEQIRAVIQSPGGDPALLYPAGTSDLWVDLTVPQQERQPSTWEALTVPDEDVYWLRLIDPAAVDEPPDGAYVALRRTYDTGLEYWYLAKRDDEQATAAYEAEETEEPAAWSLKSCFAEQRGMWSPGLIGRFEWAEIDDESDPGIKVDVFTFVPRDCDPWQASGQKVAA